MNVTYRIDKDILYISLAGRIDASNTTDVQEKVWNIRSENDTYRPGGGRRYFCSGAVYNVQ